MLVGGLAEMPVVERAGLADVPALARVQRATALHAYAGIFPPQAPKPTMAQLEAQWTGVCRRGAVFAARLDGEVVGTAHATVLGDTMGEVGGLYVLPSCWGRGLGGMLLEAALAHLHRSGASTVELWVLEANSTVRAWYERLGWQLVRGVTREVASGVDDVRYRLESRPGRRMATARLTPAEGTSTSTP